MAIDIKEEDVKAPKKLFSNNLLTGLAILASTFLYSMFIIDPQLIYHSMGLAIPYREFETTWHFFANSASGIGGILEYVSAFISHLFFYKYLASGIIALFCWSLWAFAAPSLAKKGFASLAIFPAIVPLFLYQDYFHQPQVLLTLILSLASFIIYAKLPPQKKSSNIITLLVIFAILFYLTKSGFLCFAALAFIYELLHKKRIPIAAIILVFAGITALLGIFYFGINISPWQWTHGRFIPVTPSRFVDSTYFLYAFYPAMLIFTTLMPKKNYRKNFKITLTALSLAIAAALLIISYDSVTKHALRIRMYANTDQHAKLLEYATKHLPQKAMPVELHDITMALYYTGQLPEKLFDYPVDKSVLMLSIESTPLYADIYARRADYLLELGAVALSEKFSYELLVNFGNTPATLQRLALINMVKGDIETAKVFLNALKGDFVHSPQANHWLDTIKADPTLANSERINALRANLDDNDLPSTSTITFDFYNLLEKNPKNKLAFEMMMAQLLLNGDLETFTKNLDRLNDFGIDKLPQSYDQALATYISRYHNARSNVPTDSPEMKALLELDPSRLTTFKPSRQVQLQVGNFLTDYTKNKNAKDKKQILDEFYGDTYIHFYVFNIMHTGAAK